MKKQSPQQRADLRVCASCEWVYRGQGELCPQCGFASYGAHWVYGKRCYRYELDQTPWLEKKMTDAQMALQRVINKNREAVEMRRRKLEAI